MACIPLPPITQPELPAPLSIAPPPLPPITVDLALCCKLPTISVTPPVPIPALIIKPTVLALINAAFAAINTYRDAIPLSCPRE